MSIKADRWIRHMAETHRMIEPFSSAQVAEGTISYGLSSYGYDLRLADEFKIFTNLHGAAVDPKNFNPKSFIDVKAEFIDIPPNSFALEVAHRRLPMLLCGACLHIATLQPPRVPWRDQ